MKKQIVMKYKPSVEYALDTLVKKVIKYLLFNLKDGNSQNNS